MGKDGKLNNGFLDKLIDKLEDMSSDNIHVWILRIVKEKGILETIFNTIHEGIILIDARLRIKYANKAAIEMLGLPENFNTLRISRFLRDIDWGKILQEDEEEWYRISRREIEIFYPKRRILHFYLVPHTSAKGIATVLLNDVTDQRQKAEKMLENEKFHTISLLAASVAHEIGNPLNSLYLHMQLLEKLLDDPNFNINEAKESVAIAKSEIERLDTIITHFLRVIRPSKPNLRPLNVETIINETIHLMEHEIKNKNISVICEYPEIIPQISADAGQLRQAFLNILKNAIQAMPEGGTIEIKASYDDNFVILSFIDTGKGIEPENIGNIFKPYFTSKKEGSGLGLMIVEKIIREHGAELELDSEPGKNTAITLKFPREGRRMRLLPPPSTG